MSTHAKRIDCFILAHTHTQSHCIYLQLSVLLSPSLSLCPGHLLYDLIKRANVYCNSLTPLLTRLLILIAKIIIYLSFR